MPKKQNYVKLCLKQQKEMSELKYLDKGHLVRSASFEEPYLVILLHTRSSKEIPFERISWLKLQKCYTIMLKLGNLQPSRFCAVIIRLIAFTKRIPIHHQIQSLCVHSFPHFFLYLYLEAVF